MNLINKGRGSAKINVITYEFITTCGRSSAFELAERWFLQTAVPYTFTGSIYVYSQSPSYLVNLETQVAKIT